MPYKRNMCKTRIDAFSYRNNKSRVDALDISELMLLYSMCKSRVDALSYKNNKSKVDAPGTSE
jgi:hypothetical protein